MLQKRPVFIKTSHFHQNQQLLKEESLEFCTEDEESINDVHIQHWIPCISPKTMHPLYEQVSNSSKDSKPETIMIVNQSGGQEKYENFQHGNVKNKENNPPQISPLSMGSKKGIQELKRMNRNAHCDQFLLCSEIPARIPKAPRKMTLQNLKQNCHNLDLLLFKNKGAIPKMQRLLTKANYDHVAIVIEIDRSKYILQSSGKYGVSLSDFQKFVNNLQVITDKKYQLAYRKFKISSYSQSEIQKMSVNVEEFVRKVLGKKYKFSPFYLISTDYKKKQQTYFCSQLIAECLKSCGILNFAQPSYTILPKHFSVQQNQNQDEDSDMEINAELGNQEIDLLKDCYQKIMQVTY